MRRPPRSRAWLFTPGSYATFDQSEDIKPLWLWPKPKLVEWIKDRRLTFVGEPVVEMTNIEARVLGCVWFRFTLDLGSFKSTVLALLTGEFAKEIAALVGCEIEGACVRPEV